MDSIDQADDVAALSEQHFLEALRIPLFLEGQFLNAIAFLRISFAINALEAEFRMQSTHLYTFSHGMFLKPEHLNQLAEPLARLREHVKMPIDFHCFPFQEGQFLTPEPLNEIVVNVNKMLDFALARRKR